MLPTRKITTTGGDVFRDEFSLAFDGTNHYIQLSGTQSVVANNFTIVAWVKRGETGAGHCIYSANDSTSDGARLLIDSNDDLILRLNGGDVSSDTSIISEFKAGVWYHVVGVFDDDNDIATLYANGVDVTTSSEASQPRAIGVTATPRIGNRADTNSILFNGNISEVAIYDKALSASEVKTLYNGREPYNHKEGVCSSNLKGWWRMGDGVLDDRNGLVADQTNAILGSNLVTNGTFDADSDWSKGTGWAIGSGVATCSSSNSNLSQDVSAVANKIYKINFDITAYTSGNLIIDVGGSSSIQFTGGTGNYTGYMLTANTNDLRLYGGAFRGSVDNITLRQVGDNAGVMTNMDAGDFEGNTP